jgi:hypothetical protein
MRFFFAEFIYLFINLFINLFIYPRNPAKSNMFLCPQVSVNTEMTEWNSQ